MRYCIVTFIVVVLLLGSCKEKIVLQNLNTEQPEIAIEKPVSPLWKELAKFADLEVSDSIAVNQLFLFREIDENGVVETVDVNRAMNLYEKMMQRGMATSWPIFEIKNTDSVLLFVQGVGFGGPIWAKVAMDKTSLEIMKIEFDHRAESEGYGAAMTQSSFEDKFVGTKIDLEKNTFTLQNNMEKRVDDGILVDGISGATMTSQAALEMINEGLKKYKGFLNP